MLKQNRNSGFTLLEMAVALAVLSLMAAYMTPNFLEQINEDRAHATIQETQAILDAARVYRRETGTWPGGATCATAWTVLTSGSAPYLAGVTTTNKYNSPYVLSCNANNFQVQQSLTADWDSYVANKLPATTITNATNFTITSSVGIPGTEPALSSKLSRIATGDPEDVTMRTDLLLGGNDITGIGEVAASSATISGATSTGSLSVSGNASVTGTTQTGVLGVNSNALIGGNAGVVGSTTLNGGVISNGTARFNGLSEFNEIIRLSKVVTEGSSCSPNGSIARTASGVLISCVNGVWYDSATSTYVVTASNTGGSNTSVRADCWIGRVISGGGHCSAPNATYLRSSFPEGNGWRATCDDYNYRTTTAVAYAVCEI
ncbi:TPA: shufflon system plasmid conjugative transfer pilus tip adhesin PilV [Pseudomonas aeruginosa]|nr:shufflon system plasmid conjugative transfer pilus tip adhesin PilV [Pseudomonas aeruginosa]